MEVKLPALSAIMTEIMTDRLSDQQTNRQMLRQGHRRVSLSIKDIGTRIINCLRRLEEARREDKGISCSPVYTINLESVLHQTR